MSKLNRVSMVHPVMLLIGVIVAFGLLMLCVVHAHGAEPSRVLQAVESLPTYYEDRKVGEAKALQLQELADGIESATDLHKPFGVKRKDWLALMIVIAYYESTFSLRIHQGECKPYECDRGLARGPWQQHRNGRSEADWNALVGIENTQHQAETAAIQLKRGYLHCSKTSKTHWLDATINNYAGRPCNAVAWEGLEDRTQSWIKVRWKL